MKELEAEADAFEASEQAMEKHVAQVRAKATRRLNAIAAMKTAIHRYMDATGKVELPAGAWKFRLVSAGRPTVNIHVGAEPEKYAGMPAVRTRHEWDKTWLYRVLAGESADPRDVQLASDIAELIPPKKIVRQY